MTTTTIRTQSRAKNVVLWIVQVITALGFLVAASGKFTGDPQITATFDAIGFGDWFRYLIGVLEVAGAIALFVPRLTGLAGLAFVGLMVGATFTQLVIGQSIVAPLVLLVPAAIVAWGRWPSTRRLWRQVRGR